MALDLLHDCVAILPKPISQTDLLRLVELASRRAPSGDSLLDQFCALHRLSPKQRLLFACAVRRMSASDISKATGLSPGTIHSYWGRISKKLTKKDEYEIHSQRDAVGLFLNFVLNAIAK